jgi:hypothetical protein
VWRSLLDEVSQRPLAADRDELVIRNGGWLSVVVLASLGCSAPSLPPDAGAVDAGSLDAGDHDAGAPLWPVAAQRIVGTSRGGFPTPLCTVDGGTIDGATFTLLPDGRFDFVVCELVVPYPMTNLTTGTVRLDGGQLARFEAAMGALTRASGPCGADKRVLALRLETDGGVQSYADAFYACQPEPAAIYVSGIDQVFSLFAEWAQ